MCEHCSHSGDVDTADKQPCVDCKNKQTKTDAEKDSNRTKAPTDMSTPCGRTGSLSSAEVSAGSTSGSTQQSGAPATVDWFPAPSPGSLRSRLTWPLKPPRHWSVIKSPKMEKKEQ